MRKKKPNTKASNVLHCYQAFLMALQHRNTLVIWRLERCWKNMSWSADKSLYSPSYYVYDTMFHPRVD